QTTAINWNGVVLFESPLTGTGTNASNNAAVFTGPIGNIGVMLRLGDTMLPGTTFAGGASLVQMDNSGHVLFDAILAGSGVTAANDESLWLYTPGVGRTMLVREGDSAPGTAGATFNTPVGPWQALVAPTSFMRNSNYLLTTQLMNGDVVPGVNDQA